ncbi:MAG: 30S ribosomal protein S2 [Candidatus Aenigmarchaeota archaeon]|nr:30S ribosomal protein S2 [Candidatus Aenigmarchaeota archaeon]
MMAETTEDNMLVDKTEYLTAGIHIGMKSCTPFMRRFVYKVREDGVSVFNLKMLDERLLTAAKFISGFSKIMVVSRKEAAGRAITVFARLIGAKAIAGRFPPGTLTNPSFKEFYEPDLVVVADPLVDEQAVREAKKKRIPIVAICNTFNTARDIDLVIPMNNNGKKSLALAFWILSRETLKARGSKEKFKMKIEDFGGETGPAEGDDGAEPEGPKKRERREYGKEQ